MLMSGCAMGQTFPIVPLTEPVYPYDDPDFGIPPTNFSVLRDGLLWRLGDVDADGLDDLVIMTPEVYQVSTGIYTYAAMVATQRPEGGFHTPEALTLSSPSGFPPIGDVSSFFVRDMNHDGESDFVLTSSRAVIAVYLRDGSEYCSSSSIAPPALFDSVPDTELVDLNNDGNLDLVASERNGQRAWVAYGNNQGAFDPHQPIDMSSLMETTSMRVSDADGDGDLDVLFIADQHLAFSENASGMFLPARYLQISIADPTDYFAATLADLNGDGMLDLVLQDHSFRPLALGYLIAPFDESDTHTISTWLFPILENNRSTNFRRVDTLGDLDGDGTDDLLIRSTSVDLPEILWRVTDPINMNGRFGISNHHLFHGDGVETVGAEPDRERYDYRQAFVDVSSDGVLDLVKPIMVRDLVDLGIDFDAVYEFQHVGIMLVAELGNVVMPRMVLDEQETIEYTEPIFITDADLDDDDRPEILLARTGSIRVVRRNPNDLWEYVRGPGVNGHFNSPAGFRYIMTQLDDDERPELVSLMDFSEEPIPAIYPNLMLPEFGERYFPESLSRDIDFNQLLADAGLQFASYVSSFVVEDFDLDGDNDVLIRGVCGPPNMIQDECILFWENLGDLNFAPRSTIQISEYNGNSIHMIESIDADLDGDPDLLSIEGSEFRNPQLRVYLNDGDGNFKLDSSNDIVRLQDFSIGQYWIEVCDVDHDGFKDVLVLSRASPNMNGTRPLSEVAVFYGSPSGLSATPQIVPGRGAVEVHCADFDGNGLPDLFTCSTGSDLDIYNSVSIFFQTAPREFLPAISMFEWSVAGIHAMDMNDDGGLDLLLGNPDDGYMHVLYSLPDPCLADLNLDNQLNFFDIALFVELFTQERPLVDLNRDGAHNFFDVASMIEMYSQGCP